MIIRTASPCNQRGSQAMSLTTQQNGTPSSLALLNLQANIIGEWQFRITALWTFSTVNETEWKDQCFPEPHTTAEKISTFVHKFNVTADAPLVEESVLAQTRSVELQPRFSGPMKLQNQDNGAGVWRSWTGLSTILSVAIVMVL